MNQKRMLELALDELNRQKVGIDEEIAALQAELKGTGATGRQMTLPTPIRTGKRRKRTAAERRAQSRKMKQIWAARRAKAGNKADVKALSTSRAKVRKMSDAQKKAISLKMKQVWKKRREAAAKKV